MYTSYYGLDNNFLKEKGKEYESCDYKNVISRIKYVKEIKGIGLIVGKSGLGKTYTLTSFIEKTNKELCEIVYIKAGVVASFEFLKQICNKLEINVGNCYKGDIYNKIKEKIREIKQEKKEFILIIDEAENLKEQAIEEIKNLYEIDPERRENIAILLVGTEEVTGELQKEKNESLRQRIIINYCMKGLTREEVKQYVKEKTEEAGGKDIYTETALNALYSISGGNIRILNKLIMSSLMIGYLQKSPRIDEEIIRLAKSEVEIN